MLWSAIQIALLVYAGLVAVIYFKQDSLIFQPTVTRDVQATPASIGLRFDALTLDTVDGERLDGWHVPAGSGKISRGLVIVFHGNAGTIANRLEYLRMFHDLGFACLIVDYRGYGRSSGKPSEDGTYLDAAAVWRHGTHTLGYPPRLIAVFGESLGGAIAAQLATAERPGALVLASTFTSIPDLGNQIYPWLPVRLLARTLYDTRAQLSRSEVPLLVIHSRRDDVIPFSHGERLFAVAQSRKQFLEIEGGHNDGFVFGRDIWIRKLDDFLSSALQPSHTPAAAVQ